VKFTKTASAVLALTMTTAALPGWAAEPAPPAAKIDHESITPDPAVRRGVLPNGLRYLIMRNANPKGAVSLRLGFDVGSYEEDEADLGAAHFIEHMAFRSTRGFSNGAPDRTFAPWGVAFGRDQNAMTTQFSTLYQLDLPKPDAGQLKTAFDWLRDVADGVVFTDEAVNRERGVVLAEMDTRNTPLAAAQEAVSKFQAGAQRSVRRAPIGLRSTLNAATASSLKRFYDTWYRPENAVVVVVGDLPVDDMEAMVKTGFADWTARTPKPKRAPIVQPKPGRRSEAFTVAGDTLPTVISACRLKDGLPQRPDDVAALRQAARTQLWQTILNQRLAQRVTKGDASLLAGMVMSNDMRDLSGTCLIVMPTGEAWEPALRAGQAELNRFAKDGPTDAETEKAVEQIRAQLRGDLVGVASRGSSSLAAGIVTRALLDKVTASPADTLYAYDLAVEDLTPDDLKASFAADWTGSEPLLIMTAPKPAEREALMAAWTRGGTQAPQERYADQKTAPWRYASFGPPGKVVERTVVADPGFVRLRFANGLIFDFKQSTLEPNKVNLALEFGKGRHDIDDSQYMAAELGTKMLVTGGLGKNSFEDIQAKFAIRSSWSFALNMRPNDFMLSNSGFVSGLDDQLQVAAAYMSDPGFRPDLDALLPTSFEVMYRTYATQPTVALGMALTQALDPGAPNNMPPRDVLAKLSSADLARTLKPALTGAPMELAIVGDLDEATAVKAVAATFGALPARTGAGPVHAEPRFLRYPDRAGPTLRIEHDGAADNAAAALVWPLYVATPERRREEYALVLLSRVFDTALRRRIREELGKTYSPNVGTWTPDFGDQGSLQVSIEAEPANIETLVQETRIVAEHLRKGEIDEAMLEDARAPILARARAAREANDWWTAAMAGSARNPTILREGLDLEPLMSSLTVEDLRAAAAKWLAPDPFVGVALPRAAAPAGKVAATTAAKGAAR
jgi:zinc protease